MKYKILLVLFIIALISSILLAFNGNGDVCEVDENVEEGSCITVKSSDYSSFFGIQNHYYGIVMFAFMILITLSYLKKPRKYKKYIINLGVIVGAIIAIYFLYLQQFVLNVFCKYCLVVDISMILALILVVFRRRQKKWSLP